MTKAANTATGQRKRGRQAKPYRDRHGNEIHGLARKPDGRWRIVATRYEFREADEDIAIARFRQWERSVKNQSMVSAASSFPSDTDTLRRLVDAANDNGVNLNVKLNGADAMDVSQIVHPDILFPWLKKVLLERSDWLAQMTGVPQLRNLPYMDIPRDPIRLEAFIRAYEEHAEVKPVSKRKARAVWNEMTRITGAKSLADLTTDRLLAYADAVKKMGLDPTTVDDRFTKVKVVIGFGLKRGFDQSQITAALHRAKVLVAPKNTKTCDPQPISRQDIAKLLKHGDDFMKAVLLLSLNACLYVSEAMSVDWDELDFERGTYLSNREKTGVIRAAALWPRTVAALKKLKRTPGAVFKSNRGDRYHPNSFRKVFAKVRKEAGLPMAVEFNNIRDGSYTACCCEEVPFHLAQILAGHRQPGESDKYIARNPGMVKPATDAIHRAYFGHVDETGRKTRKAVAK